MEKYSIDPSSFDFLKAENFLKKTIKAIDGRLLPVSTVFCVGQNYVKHIEELKSINAGKPLIFIKPPTSIIEIGQNIEYPSFSSQVHHEVEIAIYIGKGGKNIEPVDIPEHIGGFAIALDLTCRDIQSEAKKNQGPWAISKGFDGSSPISPIYPFSFVKNDITKLNQMHFYLKKNNDTVQNGDGSLMIFPITTLVSYISKHFTLEIGDIILTGTPEGVGPIEKGDTLSFGGDDVEEVSFVVR
jgi:2-keto-4-pentenoate hydratase/2-oxohepta-3-ene-1,7-dioic acid hydratase in catechol pathway